LIVRAISGTSVAGWHYVQVLQKIKAAERPLQMTFASGGRNVTPTYVRSVSWQCHYC
jgi:ribonuclease I